MYNNGHMSIPQNYYTHSRLSLIMNNGKVSRNNSSKANTITFLLVNPWPIPIHTMSDLKFGESWIIRGSEQLRNS